MTINVRLLYSLKSTSYDREIYYLVIKRLTDTQIIDVWLDILFL